MCIRDRFFGGAGAPFGGGARRRAGPVPGEDLEAVIEVDFEDAVFGVEAEFAVRTAVVCEICEATGAASGSGPETCGECGGTGQVQRVRQSLSLEFKDVVRRVNRRITCNPLVSIT